MASEFIPRSKPFNRIGVLTTQQLMLEKNFSFLNCYIHRGVLICTGKLDDVDWKDRYHIKIECVAGKEPKSTIIYPVIPPSRDIHMYSDHSLCLSYDGDVIWNARTELYRYTIPWIVEWIHYYEIYLSNGGKWEGPESMAHLRIEDMNENIEHGII
jgi:hypothetical protein